MGCFDTIVFEKLFKCSKCGRKISDCQTKDLGQSLSTYVITKDNRMREGWKRWLNGKKIARHYTYINNIGFGCYDYCSQRTSNCKTYHNFYIIVMDGKIAKINHREIRDEEE